MELTAPVYSADGVRARAAESLLSTRALQFLAAGPADAVSLMEYVCQMPGAPLRVAEHMAVALFADRPDFARDSDGRWRLAAIASATDPDRASVSPPSPALRSLSYVVIDVETTGTRAWSDDRVTEIAAIVVRDGIVTERFETLVNPERSIPPFITQLTRISWSMVKDKPTFREICEPLLRVMEGNIFVAHNADFDWRFVNAEVARATGQRLAGRRLCTVRLARRLLPQLRSRRLDSLCYHYGVEIAPHERHRAGGDAVATAHILLRLLAAAHDRECHCWDDLQKLLAIRAGRGRRRRPPAMPRPVDKDTTA